MKHFKSSAYYSDCMRLPRPWPELRLTRRGTWRSSHPLHIQEIPAHNPSSACFTVVRCRYECIGSRNFRCRQDPGSTMRFIGLTRGTSLPRADRPSTVLSKKDSFATQRLLRPAKSSRVGRSVSCPRQFSNWPFTVRLAVGGMKSQQ